jgi:hypothetical protein
VLLACLNAVMRLAGGFGPVGARLNHAAGGDDADGDVGPHDQQFVIALGRRELDIGILLGLDAGRERQRGQQITRASDAYGLPCCTLSSEANAD